MEFLTHMRFISIYTLCIRWYLPSDVITYVGLDCLSHLNISLHGACRVSIKEALWFYLGTDWLIYNWKHALVADISSGLDILEWAL